jgi:hypothetical protein
MANPGKQVSQSPTVVPAGRGTAATSSTALQLLASANMPRVPTRPAMLTSFAAAGWAAAMAPCRVRRASVLRSDVESHCRPR